jgi:hypothetical protein
MTITPKQKKIVWISIAALAVIYYAPAVIMAVMRSSHPQAAPRPSPFAGAAPVVPPAIASADAPFIRLMGVYSSRAMLPSRGVCGLRFELRGNHEKPGAFAGYFTLTCTPVISFQQRQWRPNLAPATVAGPKTTSTILTGTAESGAIRFHVDDVIGATGCIPTAFVLKPFGLNQIAIQWQDGCHGGSMLLNRTGR